MRRFPAALVVVFVCSILWPTVGCSSTATIYRYGAPNLDAEIVGSDMEVLLVTDQHGQVYEVPIQTVTEIDHPGNVVALVGGILAASGAMVLSTQSGDPELEQGAWIYIGVGTAMLLYGGNNWVSSVTGASEAAPRIGRQLLPGSEYPVRPIREELAPSQEPAPR